MKRNARILTVLILTAGFVFSGCGKKEEPPAAAPDASVAPDAVVARVEGTVITGQMFNQRLNALLQQYSLQFPPDQLSQLRPMLRQQTVAALINESLLLKEAVRQGITPTEEEIDQQIEEIIAQNFKDRAALELALSQQGMTIDTLRENLRPGLSIQKLIEAQLPEELEATDEEIAEFYSENTVQFERPEQVEASHILIQVSPGESEEVKAEKRREIEALRALIAGGEDFAEWARQSSQDAGTRERGGSLGYFGRGQMITAFEEAAFALESGEMSEVVETQYGYHLIKATGKKEAGTVPLEEVSEQIGMFLNNRKQQEVIGGYLRKLREGANVEYGPGFQPVPPPPTGAGQFPPPQPPK